MCTAFLTLTLLAGCNVSDNGISAEPAASTDATDADNEIQPVSAVARDQPGVDLDARRAMGYLTKICRIGPRISGTQGMAEQQKLIIDHFKEHGAEIALQTFDVAHPLNGGPVRMTNIIASWHPESKKRVLFACHYDTRPWPDRDRRNPRGRFVGANDGGSGVALFMELAHHMKQIEPDYGVDFVFFDGEELVYAERGDYFHGSEYFAKEYRDNPPEHEYVYGVLVDMIGDRRLNLLYEVNSLKYAKRLTESIWDAADDLRVREFVPIRKHEVRDDHIALNEIAKIPTCDVIDFDYPYWHTTEDVPSRCSGGSLVKVGRVLLHWLTRVPNPE